jgi:hypothetical protein
MLPSYHPSERNLPMASVRIQLPLEIASALARGESITLSLLPRKVRNSILCAIEDAGEQIFQKSTPLPTAPTQEQWAAMSMAQRESYPDEVFFEMESSLI